MRASSLVAALALVCVVPFDASVGAQAEQRQIGGGAGLTIFEDDNFGGRATTLRSATPDLRVTGLDGKASSLRVGRDEFWEVCSNRNYGGSCVVVSGAESSLRRSGWNDRIESARPVRGGGGPGPGFPRPPAFNRGIELYAGQDYSGQRILIDAATADLRRVGFADRAASLRVARGEEWEVCVNANYDDCRVVSGDVPDLGTMGFSRIISSVRPRTLGGGSGWGGGGRGGRGNERARLTVFEEPGFRGRSIDVVDAIASFPMNSAGSIDVAGGRWEICDRTGFRGNCRIISSTIRDLGTIGMRDRIESIRPR